MILFFSSQVDTLYSNHFKLFFHSVAQERTLTELISFEIPSWNEEKFRCIKTIFSMMNKVVIVSYAILKFVYAWFQWYIICQLIPYWTMNYRISYIFACKFYFNRGLLFAHSIFIFWKGCKIIFVQYYWSWRKL